MVGAREHFDGVRETDEGYLRPAKKRLVDVFVSKGTLDYALAAANTLFLALENNGHQVAFAPLDQHLRRPIVDERSEGGRDRGGYGSWGPDRATVVYVGTVAIGLTIFELSDQVEMQYIDGKYVPLSQVPVSKRRGPFARDAWTTVKDVPSGKICLRASSPYAHASWERQWRETKKGELPSKVPIILGELQSAAVAISRLVEEGEARAEVQRKEWELQHLKWEREEAERRRVQNIKESREQLAAIIESWSVAKNVEGFLENAERRADLLSDDDRVTLLEQLKKARELLGSTDALQRFLRWKAPDER
jgi:hypothetical protein